MALEGARDEHDPLQDELRAQPLLDSVRSLVNKERELAGLHLEEKRRETELWKNKYLKLQIRTSAFRRRSLAVQLPTLPQKETQELGLLATEFQEENPADESSASTKRRPVKADDDWDNMQAASRRSGDSCLRELRQRESLDLSRRGIGANDLDGVIVKLKWLRGFTSVDLSGNKIDDECAPALRNLMALKQLRRLDLRGNDIGASAGASVFESLVRCTALQVLRLEANMVLARTAGMGARVASCLRAARKAGACRYLWSLSLTADDFDCCFLNAARTTETLTRRKRAATILQSSEVQAKEREVKQERGGACLRRGSGTRAGRRAMSAPQRTAPAHPMNALAVARSFHPRASVGTRAEAGMTLNGGQGNSNDEVVSTDRGHGDNHGGITSLGLPYARLHPRTIDAIATYAVASLTRLDLSFCYIGPAGARALSHALGEGGRGSRSLVQLRLPHNAVGDAGACALGRALTGNHRLTSLDLASNGIHSAGSSALASLFRGDGVVLSHLNIGDNPLGAEATQMLVVAAAAASEAAFADRTDCGGNSPAAVEILGLERVAGASVATREAAKRVVSAGQRFEDEAGSRAGARQRSASPLTSSGSAFGSGKQRVSVLISVPEEVRVDPEEATVHDGFVQAYEVQLDSKFQSSSDSVRQSCDGNDGSGGDVGGWGNITLEIRWWLSAGGDLDATRRGGGPTPAHDNRFSHLCRWRVSRVREGESRFSVKEGVAEIRTLDTPSDSDGNDGYSPVRIVCNGWRHLDVLVIFVRPPSGNKCSPRCRDLTVRALRGKPAYSYGLLWADRDGAPGEALEADDPRPPANAEESAVVASQMHQPPPPRRMVGNNRDSDRTYRLRKFRLPYGGRIRASWRAGLEAYNSQRDHPKGADDRWGRRVYSYAWAIVRQRGTVTDEDIDEGDEAGWGGGMATTAPPPPSYMPPSARVISQGYVSTSPLCYQDDHHTRSVLWQSAHADTTSWLPGDLLTLWIRVDHLDPDPHHHAATTATVGVARGAARGGASEEAGEAGEPPDRASFCCRRRPRVREFELRVVDDAREEEIAGRALRSLSGSFLPWRRHHDHHGHHR